AVTTTAPPPPPTTTTTAPPPTTTSTAPPAPVEVAAPPVEPPPPPVETTTTTAPRPIFDNPDFLAANFSDRFVPASVTAPLPARTQPLALVLTAAFGVAAGSAGTATAFRRLPRRPRA